MLNYEFPPLGGGAANANYYLLKELAKEKNLEIDLITSSANNKYEEEQFSKNIKIYKLNVHKKDLQFWKMNEILSWTLQANKLAKKLIKENKYDLCHCWFGWPSGIIGYLNRKKVPYIVALRGSDVPFSNEKFKFLDTIFFQPISKPVWSNAFEIIVNSESMLNQAKKTLNLDFKIVQNGIDLKEFKPLKNKKSPNKIKLISVGRLNKIKGYEYLIEATKDLDFVELTLIGDGPEKENLEQIGAKNVFFKGKLDHAQIAKEYQKADIFILTSLNEGMSNSMLEAMASGLPVITTNVGGTKELIKENGFIIEQKSVDSIKQTLLKYQKNKQLITIQGKQSRKLAEKMSWNKIAEKYFKIYNLS